MAQVCKLTGRQTRKANNVSHSNQKTRTWQYPNLQQKTLVNPVTGKKETIMISTKGFKTLAKWQKEGKLFDLRDLR